MGRLLGAYRTTGGISFVAEVTDSLFLGVNQAIPCGLIVNELCTNVLRHAFPGGTEHARRELHVSLSRVQDDRVALRVADTGIGIPPDLDPDTAAGGGTFFTISYAVIDLETGRVRMVRAGHTFPIVIRADGAWEEISPEGYAVGLSPHLDLVEAELSLQTGTGCFSIPTASRTAPTCSPCNSPGSASSRHCGAHGASSLRIRWRGWRRRCPPGEAAIPTTTTSPWWALRWAPASRRPPLRGPPRGYPSGFRTSQSRAL